MPNSNSEASKEARRRASARRLEAAKKRRLNLVLTPEARERLSEITRKSGETDTGAICRVILESKK